MSIKYAIVKMHAACNWAQVLEGSIDSAHSSSLHSTDMPPARVDGAKATETALPRPSTDKAPRLQLAHTPFGFHYAAIRRPIVNSATHDYIRVSLFVAPFTVLIPPNNMYNLANVNVPRDDTHTTFYFIAWSDTGPGIDVESWRKFCGAEPGVDLDAQYRKRRHRGNNFLQDREAMRSGDWTGIRGIPMQDMAMWETMGPIAERSLERLGASDLAIDPKDPRTIFAATWQLAIHPWTSENGGPGSGIHMSRDGGTTWRRHSSPEVRATANGLLLAKPNPERQPGARAQRTEEHERGPNRAKRGSHHLGQPRAEHTRVASAQQVIGRQYGHTEGRQPGQTHDRRGSSRQT